MKVLLRFALIAGIAIGLIAIAVQLALHSYLTTLATCVDRELATKLSPDGARQAIVFERSCGATSDFNTQVSLLPAGTRLPNQPGNVFILDSNHGAAPQRPGSGPPVSIKWVSNDSLEISYDERAHVIIQNRHVGAVRIGYLFLHRHGA